MWEMREKQVARGLDWFALAPAFADPTESEVRDQMAWNEGQNH